MCFICDVYYFIVLSFFEVFCDYDGVYCFEDRVYVLFCNTYREPRAKLLAA